MKVDIAQAPTSSRTFATTTETYSYTRTKLEATTKSSLHNMFEEIELVPRPRYRFPVSHLHRPIPGSGYHTTLVPADKATYLRPPLSRRRVLPTGSPVCASHICTVTSCTWDATCFPSRDKAMTPHNVLRLSARRRECFCFSFRQRCCFQWTLRPRSRRQNPSTLGIVNHMPVATDFTFRSDLRARTDNETPFAK